HLLDRLGVYPHTAFSFVSVKAVSKILHFTDVAYCRLFEIDLQVQLSSDERDDMLQRSFCAFPALTQNHTIVGVSYELMPSAFQFLIQLIQHHISTQRA